MKTTTHIYFLLFCMLCIFMKANIFAQNDPLISQQGLQRFIINPAATGTSNSAQFGLLHRTQWNGIPDAPVTSIINANTFIPKYHLGVGIVAVVDKLGIEENMQLKSAYSYHVWLNEKNILSFGVSAGIFHKKFNVDQLILEESNDYMLSSLENKTIPDFDFGMEFNRKNLITGFSFTHFLQSNIKSNNVRHPRHLHAYIQYELHIGDQFHLKNIARLMNTSGINSLEITSIGELNNSIWLGGSYRISEAMVLMGGMFITPDIRIGYSYDFNFNVLNRYSSGSHEVFVHYKMNHKDIKSKSPRFFN